MGMLKQTWCHEMVYLLVGGGGSQYPSDAHFCGIASSCKMHLSKERQIDETASTTNTRCHPSHTWAGRKGRSRQQYTLQIESIEHKANGEKPLSTLREICWP